MLCQLGRNLEGLVGHGRIVARNERVAMMAPASWIQSRQLSPGASAKGWDCGSPKLIKPFCVEGKNRDNPRKSLYSVLDTQVSDRSPVSVHRSSA
jgi:hypothetical protein